MQWWRNAVFYQVYVPSFTDSDGDGIGDLDGVRSRLGYLELLGVDALWLSPIYLSPKVDGGYDVVDHRAVDPAWGDLEAFDALVADAHAHGLRVTVDLVPNHTSDRHAWFRAALASRPGSPERARYHFCPGRGVDGAEPPNGWRSVFGGPAWTREPERDGDAAREWYLHLFSPAQPDLNWTNLEVWADLDKTLRFWLDRGVDGFRIDAAHSMCKRTDLPGVDVDADVVETGTSRPAPRVALADPPGPEPVADVADGAADVRSDREDPGGRAAATDACPAGSDGPHPDGPHPDDPHPDDPHPDDPHRDPHGAVPRFDDPRPDDPRFDDDAVHDVHRMIRAALDHYPQRVAVGAVRVLDRERFARYVRPDELHLAVDCSLTAARFDADEVRAVIEKTLGATGAVGAAATWTLSDHDVSRPASRYGGGPRGLARARAMALVTLALPGAVYLYNGDELGLPDAELPDAARRDGVWQRAGRGRDACRAPLPWEDDLPAFGFTTGTPWLPVPGSYAGLSAAAQLEDTASTLSLYRRALELRHAHPGFRGVGLEWFGAPPDCLAFRRAGTTLVCALNTSAAPVPLPPGDPLLVSGSLDDGMLSPDTAVWLA